jgi:lipopolysaccharide/colanic/teichoic acid biosynthesis glycosyltransferase
MRWERIVRRAVEVSLAATLLLAAAPLCLLLAVGILISDGVPVFYLAERAGASGTVFRVYKFRTMRRRTVGGSRIAAARDPRVFPFGAFLRKLKLDELPQLLNIIRGEMAFVGPRPEDPWFVEHVYSAQDRETLAVPPGLTSPGTLYYFTHAEQFLDTNGTETSYLTGPLQIKLRLDREYIVSASAAYDLRLILETVWVLVCIACGRRYFPPAVTRIS